MKMQLKRISLLATIGIISIILIPSDTQAAKGWLLGVGVGAVFPQSNEGDFFKTGGATYFDFGYGFNKYFQIGGYLGADFGTDEDNVAGGSYWYRPGTLTNSHINWNQMYYGAFSRVTLPIGKNLEPYLNLGMGAYGFSDSIENDESTALGFRIGGGMNWFPFKNSGWYLGPELAYNQRLEWSKVCDAPYNIHYNHGPMLELLVKFGYQWRK